MISITRRIKAHFRQIDPIAEYRWFSLEFFLLFCLALLFVAIRHPPNGIYALLGAMLMPLTGVFYYSLRQKLITKTLCLVLFSGMMLFFTCTPHWGITLAPLSFILMFTLLHLSYFSSVYRSVVCLAAIFCVSALFINRTGYDGINAMVDVSIIFVLSLLIDILLAPMRKFYITNAYCAIIDLFIERLELCQQAVASEHCVSTRAINASIQRDMVLRNKIFQFGDALREHPRLFCRAYHNREFHLCLVHVRQSLYQFMQSINHSIACHNTQDIMPLSGITTLIQRLRYCRQKLFKHSHKNLSLITVDSKTYDSLSWRHLNQDITALESYLENSNFENI